MAAGRPDDAAHEQHREHPGDRADLHLALAAPLALGFAVGGDLALALRPRGRGHQGLLVTTGSGPRRQARNTRRAPPSGLEPETLRLTGAPSRVRGDPWSSPLVYRRRSETLRIARRTPAHSAGRGATATTTAPR